MAGPSRVFGRSGSHAWLVVPVALMLLSGGSSDAVNRCASLAQIPGKNGYKAIDDGSLSRAQFEVITTVCTRSFETSHDPVAGIAVAKARYNLGRDEEALTWVERLRGTSEEAVAWGVASRVYQRRNDRQHERTAREHVVSLRLAANQHAEAALTYYALFRLAYEQGNLRDQIEFLRLTYEEAFKAGDHNYQAAAMQMILSPLLEIGDVNSARRVLRATNELTSADRAKAGPQLPNSEGMIYLREGQPSLAISSFQRALHMAGERAEAAVLRAIYLNLVEASLDAGNLLDAEKYLKAANLREDPRPVVRSGLYYYRALVARTGGRLTAARDTALTALTDHPILDWGWQLEYELGRALEGLGDSAGAIAAFSRSAEQVEQLRRSVAVDDFKVWLLDRRREPYEALFRLYAGGGQSRKALEVLERAKSRTFLDAFIRAASTTSGEAGDITLLRESTDRLDRLQSLLPAMNQSPAAEVRPIEAVLRSVTDKNVLMYFEARDEMWLVTLLSGRIRIHRLSRSSTLVRSLVDRVVAAPDERSTTRKLGDALLPVASLPRPGSVLYIVTDGSLGRLPFASLQPRGRWLVRDYTISYLPSLNALKAATARPSAAYGPPVVMGDPRNDLPAAAQEATDVATRLGVSALLGRAVTGAQLERAANARVLHLATHTGIGAKGPWAALADADLTAASLLNRNIRPELAVLATCASAAKEGGDMWGSLAAAFLAAGSRSVLASLWSIEDKDAREFITRFYEEGGADDSAAALARTQRAFLDAGKPASFWSPYVHFGVSHHSGKR